MTERLLQLEVMRYDPERDAEPHFQQYEVPCRPEWAILDALNYIKEHLDTTLSYRWSCHMMVCGSCGMMVNGEPRLTCNTFVRDLPDRVRIEPLANFPVERDLVIVLDDFMAKLQRASPWIVPRGDAPPDTETHHQPPDALARFKQYTMCINCMACYAACPQYALDPEFIGPAALALAHRYNLDSRDAGRRARIDILADHDGVWNCSFAGACSEVCPKHVDPAAAIQQMKIESSIAWLTSRLPGGRRT